MSFVAAGEGHRTGVGGDGQGTVADPPHPVRNDGPFGAAGGAQGCLAAADQGPQGLVPVGVRGFDEGDVDDAGAAQAGGDTEAGTAAADDDDTVAVRERLARG